MKITIEATGNITEINGVRCRLWEGVTDQGTRCKVFVNQIAVHQSEDQEQFEKELREQMPPGAFIPPRMIL